jgi:hypothetical protein
MARHLSLHILQVLRNHPFGLSDRDLHRRAYFWVLGWRREATWLYDGPVNVADLVFNVLHDAADAELIERVETNDGPLWRARPYDGYREDETSSGRDHSNDGDGGRDGGGSRGGGNGGNGGGPPGPNGRDGDGLGFREVMSHPVLFALPSGELVSYLADLLGVEDSE